MLRRHVVSNLDLVLSVPVLKYFAIITPGIGRFQAIKTDVLLIFSFITGDKTEFVSTIMFSNEYIIGI